MNLKIACENRSSFRNFENQAFLSYELRVFSVFLSAVEILRLSFTPRHPPTRTYTKRLISNYLPLPYFFTSFFQLLIQLEYEDISLLNDFFLPYGSSCSTESLKIERIKSC